MRVLRRRGNWLPSRIAIALLVVVSIIFFLGRLAVVSSERSDSEKRRGDILQKSVDVLRDRSEQDRQFFELVRQIMIAQGSEQRNALIEELRAFKFGSESSTSSTTSASHSPTTTPAPQTTSTTRPPSSSPSTILCVRSLVQVCR